MASLQDSSIERPGRVFEVMLVTFGAFNRPAVLRTIRVLAQTAHGARRICRARYRRCDVRGVRMVGLYTAGAVSDTFGMECLAAGARKAAAA